MSEQLSFAERRRKLAEERGRTLENAPASPRSQVDADLIPDVGESGISDAAQLVNDACEGIDIFEVYDRLSKGVYEDRSQIARQEDGIKISCPIPGHTDKHPSTSINRTKQTWHCHRCEEGGDKFTLAAYVWGLDPKIDFWSIKVRMAEQLRGVIYERPEPTPAPPPPPDVRPGASDPSPAETDTGRTEDGPANPWEKAVEEQKHKTLIRLEGDHRARQERASGLFEPPSFVDDLEAELSEPDPEIQWTISGLHAVDGNTTITAGFKVGKTTFMMNLVKALVDQEPFLGEHEIRALDGRIALWNFEVDQVHMKRNFRSMEIKKLANIWHLPLRGHNVNLMDDTAYGWALAELRRQEIEVLILDPFSGAYYGDENDNSQIGVFTRRLDQLKREAGVRDLFMPVHTGRYVEEGNERARGGAKLDDWTDFRWVLAKHDETGDRYFKATGRGVDQEERELRFERDTNTLSYSVFTGTRKQKAGNVLKGEVLAYINSHPGCSKSAIEGEVNGKAESIRAMVKQLVRELDVVVQPGPNRSQLHYLQGQQPLVEDE